MRVSLTRPRVLAVAGVILVIGALVLGVLLPPTPSSGSANALSAASPQLLVATYAEQESTLWLVDPIDPTIRQPLFPVSHARGWALEGAVSPAGDRLALLVVPPEGHDPTTDTRLLISDGGPPTTLAEGLDLRGGLAWAADGSQIFVRRTVLTGDDRPTFSLVQIDVNDGGERLLVQRSGAGGLYPVGRPRGGPAYAVALGAGGSELLTIGATVTGRPLAPVVTRDWSLSPDGRELAYTEQRGLELRVMVTRLDETAAVRSAAIQGAVAGASGSASPAWQPDGALSVGRFAGARAITSSTRPSAATSSDAAASDLGGFSLPVAWSADGAYLALRTFAGSGPGAPGAEGAAVRDVSGATRSIDGQHLRILGWWDASG